VGENGPNNATLRDPRVTDCYLTPGGWGRRGSRKHDESSRRLAILFAARARLLPECGEPRGWTAKAAAGLSDIFRRQEEENCSNAQRG